MKENIKELLYESLMMILSIIVGVILYLDFFTELTLKENIFIKKLDSFILIIFIFDYSYRFYKSKEKKNFFIKNLIDLIAIMPFNMLFRTARLLRLGRLLRMFRIVKTVPTIHKNIMILKGILHTNDLIKILKFTLLIIITSALGILFFEEQMTNFSDAIWWAVVTASTVGYGDFFPVTVMGRLIALALMLTGIGTIGMLTGSIATFFIGQKEEDVDDLEEIIIKKIKKLNKLEEDEFNELMELISLKKRLK